MQDLKKTCNACGSAFSQNAIVCAYCGNSLLGSSRQEAQLAPANKAKWIGIMMGLAACALIAYVIFGTIESSRALPSVPELAPPKPQLTHGQVDSPAPSPTPPLELAFSGTSLTPWQLLKNPFIYPGKLVRLDFESLPIISNGTLSQYVRCNVAILCAQSGRFGIRFNRMLAADQALYDVTGIDAASNMEPEKLGEILVNLDQAGGELSMKRDWLVLPEEPTPGTNGFGAQISLPTVKFVRFASGEESRKTGGITNPIADQ